MSQPSFQIQLPENFGEPMAGIFKLIETLVSNGKQYDYILDYSNAKFTNPLFTIAIPLIAKCSQTMDTTFLFCRILKKSTLMIICNCLSFLMV